MIRNIFIILSFAVIASMLNAQSLEFYKYRVKGMGEFMARFNGGEYTDMVDPDAPNFDRQHLLQIIDYKINVPSGNVEKEVTEFTDSIIKNNVRLELQANNWIAEALAGIEYNGKEYPISVFLRMEEFSPDRYKWGIIGVDGLFEKGLIDTKSVGAISPTENEVDFIQLESILKYDPDKIASYRCKDVSLDQFTVFVSLFHSKTAKWKGVESVKYHFFAVPGYIFTVERFVRDGSNAGWLISSFKRMSDAEKENYIVKLTK